MRPRIKLTGLSAVRTELRTLADRVPDTARKTMHRSAEIIVETAKAYAPEDTGNLVESIRIIKDYAGMNGRLQIDIGIEPRGELFSASGTWITHEQFNRYSILVHENYESVADVNGPGPKTLQKMAHNPGKVGSGFLRRAAGEEEHKLAEKTIAAITKVINEVSKA